MESLSFSVGHDINENYLILETEHRHSIRRKGVCNPVWLAVALAVFGAVYHLAFFGWAAVFDVGAVEYQAVLFFARYTAHVVRSLDGCEVADEQQIVLACR